MISIEKVSKFVIKYAFYAEGPPNLGVFGFFSWVGVPGGSLEPILARFSASSGTPLGLFGELLGALGAYFWSPGTLPGVPRVPMLEYFSRFQAILAYFRLCSSALAK